MSSTTVTTPRGGPGLEQRRRLVTEVPGPRSRELMERKRGAVAAGVGVSLPVFTEAAGGGVLVDVDGNTLIDLGSGIAVATLDPRPRGGGVVSEDVHEQWHREGEAAGHETGEGVGQQLAGRTERYEQADQDPDEHGDGEASADGGHLRRLPPRAPTRLDAGW